MVFPRGYALFIADKLRVNVQPTAQILPEQLGRSTRIIAQPQSRSILRHHEPPLCDRRKVSVTIFGERDEITATS
jgi:hypothetical protein